MNRVLQTGATIATLAAMVFPTTAAGPSFVEITWMSMANLHYQIADIGIVTDGYITRIPEDAFYGGPSGLAQTRTAFRPDVTNVRRVLDALGGSNHVTQLLTGHSHWDHSFDVGTWSKLTGAPIIGSQTTCYQVMAEGVSPDECHVVVGTEQIPITQDIDLFVVRWNHSGDPSVNPEQHNAVELNATPAIDATNGGLRAGVAEDFPNGGGSRGFLFVVDSPEGRFSWFQQSSASAVDLHVPIVVNGINYGAPIDNLRNALTDAGLDSVDLWIGTGGLPIAEALVPVLQPQAYLPIHWDGLWAPFEDGLPRPFSSPNLENYLEQQDVMLVTPNQFMDKWQLDSTGIQELDNRAVKEMLGFSDVQAF